MLKIAVLSQNKDNIVLITKLLTQNNFESRHADSIEKIGYSLEKAKLCILDICKGNFEKETYYLEIFKKISLTDIPKLLLLTELQSKNLSGIKTKFDDLLFFTQLEKELIVRINFILSNSKILIPRNSLVVKELILDLEKYELTIKGLPIELTFKEYELLKILIENQNKVFSRSKLLSTVWGYNFYGGSRTVDVHMRRLRTKITSPYDQMLKTIRNVGYMFSPKI
ncbi:MAG: response regulator transcription factor [Actinobacteria bacterium]|nr:response regulator transcription factor [Actinomycetota bacterium]